MTELVLTNAQIRFGGRDITGLLNQIELTPNRNLPENTAFGDTTMSRLAGVRDASATISGWWDVAADSDIFSQHGSGALEVLSFTAEGATEGNIAYSLQGHQSVYGTGAAHGEIYPFNFEMQGSAALLRGFLAGAGAKSVDGNSLNYNLGALAAGDTLWAALHVTAQSGTTPTLDVIVESSPDGVYDSDATTRITFTQVTTTLGAQFMSAAGPITDPHFRMAWTLGGGSPNYTIFGVIGKTAG